MCFWLNSFKTWWYFVHFRTDNKRHCTILSRKVYDYVAIKKKKLVTSHASTTSKHTSLNALKTRVLLHHLPFIIISQCVQKLHKAKIENKCEYILCKEASQGTASITATKLGFYDKKSVCAEHKKNHIR